jgi:hypothetical protein
MGKTMKRKTGLYCGVLLLALFAVGCASTSKKETSVPVEGPFYEEGKGRADMKLAILRPAGAGLSDSEEKYLDLLQGGLNYDFNRFSGIVLSDRQNYEQILKEQDLLLSPNFSEEEIVSIGKMTQNRYILYGKLTKLDAVNYSLSLNITDVEKNEITASYLSSTPITGESIRNMSAIRAASAYLLKQLGVVFTPAGEKALTEAQSAGATDSQNALALSYEASRNGELVNALIYSYNATDADEASLDAKKQADAAFLLMGGAGESIKEDFAQRDHWQKNLTEFEDHYAEHPPFTMYYTSIPVQEGASDYDSKTVNFSFKTGLRKNREVKVMQKVIDDVNRELKKTNYKKNNWGFNDWPVISAAGKTTDRIPTKVFNGYLTFAIEMGLFNNLGEKIGTTTYDLYGQLVYSSGKINSDATQERKILFTNIDKDLLTEDMLIKVVSVNKQPYNDWDDDALIKTIVVQKMPSWESSSIAKSKNIIPELEEERQIRLANEAAKESRRQKLENMPLAKRFGIYGGMFFDPVFYELDDAFTVTIGLEGGYKHFAIDIWGEVQPVNMWNRLFDKDKAAPYAELAGLGLDMGYTFLWNYFNLSIEAGAGWEFLYKESGIIIPNMLVKFNVVPFKRGFTLEFGCRTEFASPSWSDSYLAAFNKYTAWGSDDFRVKTKFLFALAYIK